MRVIILIAYNPYFESSASANRWLTLINGLADLEVEIFLHIYGGFKSIEEKEKFNTTGHYGKIHYNYINSTMVDGYWLPRFYNYFGIPGNYSKVLSSLIEMSNKGKLIVWTDSNYFSLRIAVALKNKSKSLKLFIELSEFFDIHRGSNTNLIHKIKEEWRLRYFEKKAVFAYDAIALMTKTLYRYIESLNCKKVKLLHLPMTVDIERFENCNSSNLDFDRPYILFVGNMENRKDGVGILIEAFNIIHTFYPEYKLYLVGPWNYDLSKHQNRINELLLENKIVWKGLIERNEIPSLMNNANLLVLPRPDSKQAKGGFPTKLGEYLATGNPVCATMVGELPEYLTDNISVFFAEPGSVDSFANAMHKALSDMKHAKVVGENGKAVAQSKFNKNIQSLTLFEFFKMNL